MNKKTKITFLHVRDNAEKLRKLGEIVHKHFYNKEALLIAVPSPEAATYLDQLLWRLPEESFIPHTISLTPTKERVVISPTPINVNQAKILINLRPELPLSIETFHLIYELFDLTHPSKEQISRQHLTAYQQGGWALEEIN